MARQSRLWSFQMRDTKLESFLAKNQVQKMNFENFENWNSGELSKIILGNNVIEKSLLSIDVMNAEIFG